MNSPRLGATVDAIDLFCGFGGSSQGIHDSGAEVKLAANHNDLAVDVHAANFPDADHLVADLQDRDSPTYVDPADLPEARFMWASPSCRFHSPANAKKLYRAQRARNLFDLLADAETDDLYAQSERSRVTMVCPLRYAAKRRPELVIVENVVEAAKWGPDRDGSTFKWWLGEWEKAGYEWDAVFLNSMFFPPTPQSRDRMYVVFWRRGNQRPDLEHRPLGHCTDCGRETVTYQSWKRRTKAWPTALERWGKHGTQYVYRCVDCNATVQPNTTPAFTAIDWSDLGPTIGQRTRALAPKTLDRIRRGLEKFKDWPAVVIPAAGNTFERPGQTRAKHVGEPLFTQTGTIQHGVASMPFLIEMRGGGSVKAGQHPITGPMHTVTAGGLHHGFVATLRGTHESALKQNHPLTLPLTTIATRGHHGLITSGFTKFNGGPTDTAWHPMTDPLGVVTSRDTTGLASMTMPLTHAGDRSRHVSEPLAAITTARERYVASHPLSADDLDSVHFRMLHPEPELQRAMAFAEDYILRGTKTQKAQGLGNAVTPPVAAWLTDRALETLR